jgi:hypothetical protein
MINYIITLLILTTSTLLAQNFVAFIEDDGDLKYINMQTGSMTDTYEDNVSNITVN